jgi:hypothetical protein
MRLLRLVRQGQRLVVFPRTGRAFGGTKGGPQKGPPLKPGKNKGGQSFIRKP